MKRSTIFLLSMAFLAVHGTQAGSAVAISPHNQMVYSYGHSKEVDKRQAFELARSRYGANVRILAASDVTGYGAIAVAAKGRGSVVGVALGRPAFREAEDLAIEQCLKMGGTNPKVKWRFKG
jgi:hypothetical protein